MSLILLYGMRTSRSPEDFIRNYLLPGLRERRLPGVELFEPKQLSGGVGRRLEDPVSAATPSVNKMKAALKSLSGERYHLINLVNKADLKQFFPLSIGRTVYTDERILERRGQPLPKFKIRSAFCHLHQKDYDHAAKFLGELESVHPGEGGSISYDLKVPREAIDHDDWSPRIEENAVSRAGGKMDVFVEREVFNELAEHVGNESFLHDYLNTLSLIQGRLAAGNYEKLVPLPGKNRAKYPQASAYQHFHIRYNMSYGELMRQLVMATRQEDVEGMLKKHLGASDEFAAEYGNSLWSILQTRGGHEDAEFIASNAGFSMNEWRNIRSPRPKIF